MHSPSRVLPTTTPPLQPLPTTMPTITISTLLQRHLRRRLERTLHGAISAMAVSLHAQLNRYNTAQHDIPLRTKLAKSDTAGTHVAELGASAGDSVTLWRLDAHLALVRVEERRERQVGVVCGRRGVGFGGHCFGDFVP